ncbi:MAG: GPI inositol-deacylase [Spirochaetes bacterium]|nr:GPI inositol-deacylase [Spirochaetota bacterium]
MKCFVVNFVYLSYILMKGIMNLFEKIRNLFSRKIIILIHGLENKPAREILKNWCICSIKEGLERIGERRKRFAFELVYWADLFYERPQDPLVVDETDPSFLDDPYVPSEKIDNANQKMETGLRKKKKELQQKFLDFLEKHLDDVFFDEKKRTAVEKISDFIVQKLFRDLDIYYHKNCPVPAHSSKIAKEEIRNRLRIVLRKHRRQKIMLIAHSMGSIVAYDVLSLINDVAIDTFITIGSPLGLPLIMKKIFDERGLEFNKGGKTPTPESIRRKWLNFSDLSDPIAINYDLADDYAVNSRGVGPIDVIVENDYQYRRKRNHHKLYGYLRTPEIAKAIAEFLDK